MKILIIMTISMMASLLEVKSASYDPQEDKDPNIMKKSIRKKLEKRFHPKLLHVVNNAYEHDVPKTSESFIRIIIVSDVFEGMVIYKRNNMINDLLKEELETSVHGLFIVAKTPAEWDKDPTNNGPYYEFKKDEQRSDGYL